MAEEQDQDLYSFVTDPPESYLCQICMKVLQEPHATECCGQHYCRACLEKWFKKKYEEGEREVCPHCREENFNHILYKPLMRKINELEVYCSNRERGCQKILKLSELEIHLNGVGKNRCDYIAVECPNYCGESVVRHDLESHLSDECIKREATCVYCSAVMEHCLMEGHTNLCDEKPVPCPRNCGLDSLRYGDLKKHEEVCPNVKVKCLFADAGCTEQLLRKDLSDHMDGSTVEHLAIVYATLKADCDKLKEENDLLKTNDQFLRQSCEALKTQTAQLRADLDNLRYSPLSGATHAYHHQQLSGPTHAYHHHHQHRGYLSRPSTTWVRPSNPKQ